MVRKAERAVVDVIEAARTVTADPKPVALSAPPAEAKRRIVSEVPEPAELAHEAPRMVNEVGDDRDNLQPGDTVMLIVENESMFARYLLDAARERGMKGITTSLGVTALALAAEYKPAAVTLDIHLPDIAGWRVLDRLKNDPQMRHVPVAVISTDDARERALESGAFAFLAKPVPDEAHVDALLQKIRRFVERERRTLLAVSGDPSRLEWFATYLGGDDVEVLAARDVPSARALMADKPIDALLWDAGTRVADADLRPISTDESFDDALPVVLYGERGGEATRDAWRSLGRRTVVREASTPEALLDQTALVLHRQPKRMPEAHRIVLSGLHGSQEVLAGRRAMVVDDDMRNIFALSSLLEDKGMEIVAHDNGRAAIASLAAGTPVDVILMDIMMPEMDGIDTIREIRKLPAYKDVPIIAVTAKAMKGDREKCMEAGAWDYLSKPVDTELMVGVLRAWLSR